MTAEPKGKSSTISEGNRAVFPQESLDHLKAQRGSSVSFYNVPGPAVIVIKTDSMNVASFLKSLLAVVAVIGILTTFPMAAYAHGQEAVPVDQPVIQPTVQGPPSVATVESITLAGDAAHFPLRVEFTYPSGINPIWNVSKGSVFSVYSESATVGVGGITTKTWSTGMADTFRIRFGEHYPAPTDQIAIVRVFTNSTNPNTVPDWIIPIEGTSFERELVLITSPTPHQPTPEELAAPVLNELQATHADVLKGNSLEEQNTIAITLTAGALQGGLGLVIILCGALGVATTAVFIIYRKLKDVLEPARIEEIGAAQK